MTPLLFGPSSRRLFGIHQPAERAGATALLIAVPFGQEAIRTHRFFRVLCERLSRVGVATLRYDPYGSGDSGGSELEGDLDGWTHDVGVAHRTLRGLSGDRCIDWLGARLGGTVTVRAASLADSPEDRPARLMLWDPVLDGRRYLAALRVAHVDALERSFFEPDAGWRRALRRDPDAFGDEALGTAISALLQRQLRELAPDVVAVPPVDTVLIARTADDAARRWAGTGADRGRPIRSVSLDHALNWTRAPESGNPAVPAEAIQRLVREIDG